MMNAAGVQHHRTKGRYGCLVHVVIPLLIRFKGKTDLKIHPIPAVNRKALELQARWWFELLSKDHQ